MLIRRVFLGVVFWLWGASVLAQPPAGPEYLSAAHLREAIARLPGQPATALRFKLLGERGTYNYWIVQRDSTGQVEQHADWHDVFVVQTGQGTLLYGGQLQGGRETGPGEMLGGTITGGMRQPLGTNDVMIIPAGQPHQVWVEPGQSILYVIIKVKRQAESGPK